ncbi:methylenetetrahydrofolate reductase [NAD(P)H] [Luteithermobacter gelatinilyticus]|uniref:methylenetetrahydrofolate reductase [NAD(P)H] n=1 Tax=Luteithermobacter gelatinilyticus TaxID=2582913 RepID=UPI001AF00C42|nr:methylenetetrahydrofolate reductase [NAD(P)H] [Luteithermobacter gelatinilyticus]
MTEDQKADLLRPNLFATEAKDIKVSFEFFPPKTEQMEQTLWSSIRKLEPLQPEMVSVTYGAGGSTRERTHATVSRILKETTLTPAAHLTCVAASRGEVDDILRQYWDEGVRHIVALRGDMPTIGQAYTPHPEGYRNAADLVAGIRKIGDFDISVAAYPECHPDSPSLEADIDNLKRKIDAGANRAITQYFFDVDLYFRFLDRVLAAGIDVPIVPGIMPVTNFKMAKRFSEGCGTSVPHWLEHLFEGLDDRPAIRRHVAAVVAAEQCIRLYQGGVKNYHFYTLNRAELTLAICHILGIRPKWSIAAGESDD